MGKNLVLIQNHPFDSDTASNIFRFLTTSELGKFQKTNLNTFKSLRALTFLRRIHSITRILTYFENFIIKYWEEKERRVLTNIRDKLVNDVGVSSSFANIMVPNSLKDFNRSIEWLDRYEIDDQFIDLLLANDFDGTFWNSEEILYVNNWKKEFKMWHMDEENLRWSG